MTLQLQHAEGDPSVDQNFRALAQRFPINASDLASGTPGSTLPTSPVNGQEFVYQTATAGVFWRLVRDSATGYWVVTGGSALWAEVTTNEQAAANVVYSALATAGPTITLPLAGDYDISVAFFGNNNGAGVTTLMSYDLGATGAADADAAKFATAAAAGAQANIFRERRKTTLAAGTVLTAKYRTTTASSGFFGDRVIRAMPIRVLG